MDILIVIANAELSRIIGDVLRAEGHAVWEAADARTAFRALMSRLPDVALLDVKLPDIGGVDVLRALRESPGGRGVTALLIADDPLRTRWEARDLEPERVLTKPIDVLDLTDLVREIAARRGDRPSEGESAPTVDAPAPPPAPTLPPAAQVSPTLRSIPPDAATPPLPPRPARPPSQETVPPRPGTRSIPPGTMRWSANGPSQPPAPQAPPGPEVRPPPPAARTSPPSNPGFSPDAPSRPPPSNDAWKSPTRTSIPPTDIPRPGARATEPSAPTVDAWGVLGIPRGSSPEVILGAVERLIAEYSETANREKSLDARARASSMAARVRAASRELLGDVPSPPPAETE
ncbi:MAG: response regulator [Myxococcota bacterium]